jgi:hypothetical protein
MQAGSQTASGAATHLGAHPHAVERRTVHRTVRSTRDLGTQLQLARWQHERVHRRVFLLERLAAVPRSLTSHVWHRKSDGLRVRVHACMRARVSTVRLVLLLPEDEHHVRRTHFSLVES